MGECPGPACGGRAGWPGPAGQVHSSRWRRAGRRCARHRAAAMKRILVFQHVPYEPLGYLNPQLKQAGFRIRYVNFGREPGARPTLDGYSGLVVLGGPMSVNQTAQFPHLLTEIDVIHGALERGMPVLGICLGAQLMARALGASVRRSASPEIGWYPVRLTDSGREDPLFSGFGPEEHIFQWHSDTFDLPQGAIRLASSDVYPNQAFRFGRNAYAFQFHIEVTEQMILEWLRHEAVDLDRIGRDTAEFYADYVRRAKDFYATFFTAESV